MVIWLFGFFHLCFVIEKCLIWIDQAFFCYIWFLDMIKPQPGPQEQFLSTPADIAIYGGSAGGGKSFMLLMEPSRHFKNKDFSGIIFRRLTPQITNPGGLWPTSGKIYSLLDGKAREHRHDWRFASGATMRFSHLQYEKDKETWQGSELAYIGFDELTHFTKSQFTYFYSRNRSTSGVRGYIRASCNPDPDSWVAKFIEWWIDQETGFPIPERAGVIRYMVVSGDDELWFGTREEAYEAAGKLGILDDERLNEAKLTPEDLIKSVTFIPGSIFDNKILIAKDPGYLGSLLALPTEERAMLLDGNWKVRTDGLGLGDYQAIKDIYTNQIIQPLNPKRYITCDAARFGKDFCVIMVWLGWRVVHMSVYKKSDVNDIVDHIELLRAKYGVMKSNVLVDQDGVGGDSVSIGKYRGFRARDHARKDPKSRVKEDYENLKTQCVYWLFEKFVNTGEIQLSLTPSSCWIYDQSSLKPKMSVKIKVGAQEKDVRVLLQEDLRSFKRVIKKDIKEPLKIENKDAQKLILGRSPDFGDTLLMRVYFELISEIKTFTGNND